MTSTAIWRRGMTIDEMKERKRELGYSIDQLAQLSGVPKGTLQKIFAGQTKSPRRETVEKLSAALEPQVKTSIYSRGSIASDHSAGYSSSLQKADNPYGEKTQGDYTVEDYLALPEENRYELIDGVIYEMSSPSRNHQVAAGYLYHQLMTCAYKHPGPCYPYMAPLDVQLNRDNKTMVQPDVMICCDPELTSRDRIFGAPEFLAEVVSPSSANRDRFIKLSKYKEAGVKEYWIIEPEKYRVIVFLFCEDDDIHLYSFDDEIPVHISDGLCLVNFSGIKSRLMK